MTLADHAEAWTREQGLPVPPRTDRDAWRLMYQRWCDFAFADFE